MTGRHDLKSKQRGQSQREHAKCIPKSFWLTVGFGEAEFDAKLFLFFVGSFF